MFWIICAAMVAVVSLAILAPVWRARGAIHADGAAEFDLRVYRDQLREVDRDLERGVIGAEDAERLRVEIGRKVLDADRRLATEGSAGTTGARLGAGAVLAALVVGGAALYWTEGAPGSTDLPIAQRIALAQASYESRPSQTEAEAALPALPGPAIDDDYRALLEQLRDTVARNPDDLQGQRLLVRHELELGNLSAAREAQQRVVEIRGQDATTDDLMGLAVLMVEAAGGVITPEAEDLLARTLKASPTHPQARYLLGTLQLQNGRPDRAFPVWKALLEEGPDNAPWNTAIRATISELAWLAGEPDYVPPEPAPLPGPDAEALAQARDMTPEQRREWIGGMVAGLETRLAEQGGTPEEWARLISSLAVLGERDRAQAIWAEAQQTFSGPGLDTIRAAADQAGLTQ